MTVNRITLFKIPEEAARAKLVEIYKTLQQRALKDGKPYILGAKVGSAFPDQRSQGYTFAVQTTFASADDMAYYDSACSAHADLKSYAKTVSQGNMVVYFENALE
ncbi:stress responsive A/B barrel domain-containing protein [Microdochium trichocladiopsis]|uniref:Stress responsive A/B barrel domain-containing protein n=1 Tax=Microdochium trichocladiopsis TaxID=1682393 RepID=A0A9P9BLR3_9PEZI|nr:stress responsive A/B barrel domain-containing protein [Microdochium trichocladiopsis]KAH7024685.1 stress responsive A/B barrel domain-containing protein [Microdochium trichocladiopsis]